MNTKEYLLGEFLADAFASDEQRLLCLQIEPLLLHALPDPPVDRTQLGHAIVSLLKRRAMIHDLFRTIQEARPRRAEEVERLAHDWEPAPVSEVPWLAELHQRLVPLGEADDDWVDRSLSAVQRRLALAERLLHARRRLTEREWDVFAATTTIMLVAPKACLDATEAALSATRELAGLSPAIRFAFTGARSITVPTDMYLGHGSLRLGLVLALARLMSVMACTREFLARPNQRPPNDAADAWWFMYLAHEWSLDASGILHLHLWAFDRSWAEPIRGATALAVKVEWERLCGVLTLGGIAMTLAPCDVRILPEHEPPPRSVLVALRERSRENRRQWPKLPHLGGERDLEALLRRPLAWSVCRYALVFELDGDPPRRVVLWATGDERPVAVLDGPGRKILDLAGLTPWARYCWRVERDDGLGRPTAVTSGEVLVAPALVGEIGDSPAELARYHLWAELVCAWWSRRNKAPAEVLIHLLDGVRHAYDWLCRHDSNSSEIDLLIASHGELGGLLERCSDPKENP